MTERFGSGPLVPSTPTRRRPRGGPRPGDARARSTGAPAVRVWSSGSSGSRGDGRARERRGGEREREGDRWRTTTAPDTRTRADAFEADARGSGAGGARTHASFADSAAASHNRGSSGRRSGARSARSARRTNQNIRASRNARSSGHRRSRAFVHRCGRRCPMRNISFLARAVFFEGLLSDFSDWTRAPRNKSSLLRARCPPPVRETVAPRARSATGRCPGRPVDDETRQTGSRGHQRARRAFARRSAPRGSRARVSAPAFGAGARVTGGRGSVASRGARANARRRHGWRPESPSERASVATQLHREPADQPRAVRLDVHAAEGGGRTTLPQGRARGAAHAGDDRAALRPGAHRVLR